MKKKKQMPKGGKSKTSVWVLGGEKEKTRREKSVNTHLFVDIHGTVVAGNMAVDLVLC